MSNYTKISFNANKGAAFLLQAFKHGITSNMQNKSLPSNMYFIPFQKVTTLWNILRRLFPHSFTLTLFKNNIKYAYSASDMLQTWQKNDAVARQTYIQQIYLFNHC